MRITVLVFLNTSSMLGNTLNLIPDLPRIKGHQRNPAALTRCAFLAALKRCRIVKPLVEYQAMYGNNELIHLIIIKEPISHKCFKRTFYTFQFHSLAHQYASN
jgi:hypothetical protein